LPAKRNDYDFSKRTPAPPKSDPVHGLRYPDQIATERGGRAAHSRGAAEMRRTRGRNLLDKCIRVAVSITSKKLRLTRALSISSDQLRRRQTSEHRRAPRRWRSLSTHRQAGSRQSRP